MRIIRSCGVALLALYVSEVAYANEETDTITLMDSKEIARAASLEQPLDKPSAQVMDCVHGKLAPREKCFCLYPVEIDEVKDKYDAALQRNPEWKDRTVFWTGDSVGHNLSLLGLRRQLEMKCEKTPQNPPGNDLGPNQRLEATIAQESYSLFQMTGGEVIKVVTGKLGEQLQLLMNPAFSKLGDGDKAVTVPVAPKDPIWQEVPDGTYKTLAFGTSYVVKDRRIVQVLDRNGHDITSK
jgi:hypothetical protein